jgi:hypothetical protein
MCKSGLHCTILGYYGEKQPNVCTAVESAGISNPNHLRANDSILGTGVFTFAVVF